MLNETDRLTLIGFLAGCLCRVERVIAAWQGSYGDPFMRECFRHQVALEFELRAILSEVQ